MTKRETQDDRARIVVALGIAILALIVFWPVTGFDFVNYDDLEFIVENPHVASGLGADNLAWAFANAYSATGGPLTWISHMLDVEMFGMDAGWHHATSLALHLCNALLLFAVLSRMTGTVWRCALVAALFAIHPLHVESVAWIAERKDVLSTLFWLLTIWAYASYAEHPGPRRYATVIACFTFGLSSKPMVATLPFVLLLLDVWPLGRWRLGDGFWRSTRSLAIEKLPLFALAVVSMGLVLSAQTNIGAVAAFETLPLRIRLSNAAVSYLAYLGKAMWPAGLVPFYPYRDSLPAGGVVAAVAVLIALTAAAIVCVRRAPYMTVGWLWYVGTLVPVIGIVQIGGHAMADRFTYIPLIGIFILIAWTGAAAAARAKVPSPALAGAVAILVLAAGIVARGQVMHWKNGISLWQHTVAVSADNARAHANLGVALARVGQRAPAIAEYQEALQLDPRSAETHNNLALALVGDHKPEAALGHYFEAVRLKPDYANAHTNLANLLDDQGHTADAIDHYREAIRLEPSRVLAHLNLAIALAKSGRVSEAVAQLEAVLRLEPGNQDARRMLEDLRRPTS
jgi:tetratricopeptide (TPR) repeat protein